MANPFQRADPDGAPSMRPTAPESAELPMEHKEIRRDSVTTPKNNLEDLTDEGLLLEHERAWMLSREWAGQQR